MSKVERQLVFIDDSGDPGIINSPSEYIFMAAVVFNNPKSAERASSIMTQYRKTLGWNDKHEFKFRKNPKNIKIECLNRLCECDFLIYSTYIDKKSLVNSSITDMEKLRDLLIVRLLRNIPLRDAKITIDGDQNEPVKRRKISYFRKVVNPNHDRQVIIKYEDSVKDNLVQLADLVAGGINRSFKPDKTDSQEYVRIFKSKIQSMELVDLE